MSLDEFFTQEVPEKKAKAKEREFKMPKGFTKEKKLVKKNETDVFENRMIPAEAIVKLLKKTWDQKERTDSNFNGDAFMEHLRTSGFGSVPIFTQYAVPYTGSMAGPNAKLAVACFDKDKNPITDEVFREQIGYNKIKSMEVVK